MTERGRLELQLGMIANARTIVVEGPGNSHHEPSIDFGDGTIWKLDKAEGLTLAGLYVLDVEDAKKKPKK